MKANRFKHLSPTDFKLQQNDCPSDPSPAVGYTSAVVTPNFTLCVMVGLHLFPRLCLTIPCSVRMLYIYPLKHFRCEPFR